MDNESNILNKPKALKGFCHIGAVFAPDHSSMGGFQARDLAAPDANNLLPQTYYYKSNSIISSRLVSSIQASGGVIPEANRYIGAPLSTFAYGGIAPGEVHPQLDLIQGPSSQDSIEVSSGVIEGYNPPYTSTATFSGTIGDGTLSPINTDSPRSVNPPQYPTIPGTRGFPFKSAQNVHTTYNIWKLVNLDSDTLGGMTYKKNLGPQFPSKYNAARIRQNTGIDGSMGLEVTASNCTAQLLRVFPMSKDLMYSGATLYYPHPSIPNLSRPIAATGGENCGFQLHFKYASITQMNNSTSNELTGGINIFWGAPPHQTSANNGKTLIQNYNLILYPGRTPQLYFFHPRTHLWVSFPLKGPSFGDGEYDIYVHYCGPHMMVGFETDPTNWNCFTPPEDNVDQSRYYYPSLPSNAEIGMIFDNITAVFQYGPIAFNNYHPDQVQTLSDFNSGHDLGSIHVNFTVPKSKRNLLEENALNSAFQDLRFDASHSKNKIVIPSFYGDSRSAGPELSFHQLSAGPGVKDKDDFQVGGIVRFDTTVEGPQFLHIRNSKPDTTSPSQDLVRKLSWGDVSEYMTAWTAEYTLEGGNRSFLNGKATVTLKNLAMSEKGRQILAALETNIFGITLGGGENSAVAFFQGATEISDTIYSDQGSTTTLSCIDLATWVTKEVPVTTSLTFSMMTYGDIIGLCVSMTGLENWYEPFSTRNKNHPFLHALNLRLGVNPFSHSLAQKSVQSDVKSSIYDLLQNILGLTIGPNALPVFMWDAVKKKLRLEWRNDENATDKLWFLGTKESSGEQTLPSSAPEGKHGVLKNDYKTTFNLKQLHSGVLLFGSTHYAGRLAYQRYFDEAYKQVGFDKLDGLVGGKSQEGNEAGLGWVGIRKYLIDEVQIYNFPDQVSLDKYGVTLTNNYLRQTYGSVSFSCWVTRPLNHYATFRILTFGGAQYTSPYFYKSVKYKFNKEENTLEAEVEGEILPPILKKTS